MAFRRSARAGLLGFAPFYPDPRISLTRRVPDVPPQVLNIAYMLALLVVLLSGSVMGQSYGSRRSMSQYGSRKLSQYNGRRLNQYRKRSLSQY